LNFYYRWYTKTLLVWRRCRV